MEMILKSKEKVLEQKGQATLETLISLVLAIPLLALVFLLLYFSFIKNYIDFQSHEALVCEVSQRTNQSIRDCKRHLKDKIESVLFFAKLEQMQFQKTRSDQTVHLSISIFSIQPEKSIQWNLRKSIPVELTKR